MLLLRGTLWSGICADDTPYCGLTSISTIEKATSEQRIMLHALRCLQLQYVCTHVRLNGCMSLHVRCTVDLC